MFSRKLIGCILAGAFALAALGTQVGSEGRSGPHGVVAPILSADHNI